MVSSRVHHTRGFLALEDLVTLDKNKAFRKTTVFDRLAYYMANKERNIYVTERTTDSTATVS